MSTVSASVRLRTLILGVRPSLVHAGDLSPGLPVDNLTEAGVEAWRSGLTLLGQDLDAVGVLMPRDLWIRDWVGVELERDRVRWCDASSMLRLLTLALGPVRGGGPAGRAFWGQWERNLAYLVDLVDFAVAGVSSDTAELAEHCAELVGVSGAPASVVTVLDDLIGRCAPDGGPRTRAVGVSRPLATEVERIYLADIVAASFATTDACRAAVERFYRPGPAEPSRPCSAGRNRRSLHTVGPFFRSAD